MTSYKQKLRQDIWRLCEQVAVEQRQYDAARAAKHFFQSGLLNKYQHIACYMSLPREMNTQPLLKHIIDKRQQCYLPVIDKKHHGVMRFAIYRPGDCLITNKWGIAEPTNDAEKIRTQDLDIIIMPLTAFDRQGNRLGSGAGYYDRTLAGINHLQQRPVLCGYAYRFQQVEQLVPDDWDVPLDMVLTEQGITIVRDNHSG
ncbi:MAG: 5-formyltetrahydrofolate cyclo-ligase [Pseudomonadota bacterium]